MTRQLNPNGAVPRIALGYAPGGRWERILRLIRSQPMARAEIFDALRTDQTALRIERRKIHFALSELMRRDLIAWTSFGFVATAQGVRELERSEPNRLSASSAVSLQDMRAMLRKDGARM